MGDISENAEYDAAKDAQAHCEARIAELEAKLANVRIIEDQNIATDKVYIGALGSLKDEEGGEKIQDLMVGPEEASFEENRLSIFAPIGKELIEHKEGEEVQSKSQPELVTKS